jgi:hypothetical protein
MHWTGSFRDVKLFVRLNKNRHLHPRPEASQSGVREAAVRGLKLRWWRFC